MGNWVSPYTPVVVYRLSTEDIFIPITVTMQGNPYDPTGDEVYFGFVSNLGDTPSWNQGSWTTEDGVYYATCLVGPDNNGVSLDPGTYYTWVKIVDDPEVPVLFGGYTRIS